MTKLRLIQCGVGGFGASWLHDFVRPSPDFELAAVVDPAEAALHAEAERAGVPADHRFTALTAALAAVEADAVLTAAPPAAHLEHARLAFARGLHLLTEKPMADTLASARAMAQAAAAHNRQLVVSQNYRYRPAVQALRGLLVAGAAGAPGHGHIDFYIAGDFTGTFRETMPFPLLIDMAVHHFDLIRCVTGRDIVRVTALGFRPAWSWYAHQPAAKALLELDGGLIFSYSGDWSARGSATSWNGSWHIQCAEGALRMADDAITIVRSGRWNRDTTVEPVEAAPLARAERAATLHAFAQAIRTGQPAETSGSDNLNTLAAVFAAVRSAETKLPVLVADMQ